MQYQHTHLCLFCPVDSQHTDTWSLKKHNVNIIYVHFQILETVPVSDEVSDLVQKLGNFYTEVEGDEGEDNEVDKRPFTRPFTSNAGTL